MSSSFFLFFGISYNFNNRNVKFTFDGHSSGVSEMHFTQDLRYLISAGYSWEPVRNQPEIKIWDLETGKNLSTISLQEKYIDAVALSPDNSIIACATRIQYGSGTHNIHLYKIPSGKIVGTVSVLSHNIIKLLFSKSGKYIGMLSKSAHVYETGSVHEQNRIKISEEMKDEMNIEDVAFTDDEQLIASGSSSDSIFIWNVSTRQTLHSIGFKKPPDELGMANFVLQMSTSSLLLSQDASILVNDRSDGITIYDVASGKKLHSIGRDDYTIDKTYITSDNKRVLSIPSYSSLQVWDIGAKTFCIDTTEKNIYDGAISIDGKYILVVESSEVKILDATNGKKKMSITHREKLYELGNHALVAALSPDNRFLATGGAKIKIWEIEK